MPTPFFEFEDKKGQQVQLKLSGSDIAADIEKMEGLKNAKDGAPFSNWQPLLRAIQPHRNHLKTVWLIGSSGKAPDSINPGPVPRDDANTRGSGYALEQAMKFVQPYLKDVNIRICRPNKDLQFQDLAAMESVIESIVHKIGHKNNDRIVIDVTGGLKTASILGAMMTVKQTTRFQYVDTIPPKPVIQFDMRMIKKELGI